MRGSECAPTYASIWICPAQLEQSPKGLHSTAACGIGEVSPYNPPMFQVAANNPLSSNWCKSPPMYQRPDKSPPQQLVRGLYGGLYGLGQGGDATSGTNNPPMFSLLRLHPTHSGRLFLPTSTRSTSAHHLSAGRANHPLLLSLGLAKP